MARRKVALRYIADNNSRRDSFKTRSQGLRKKAGEVATLCKAKSCVIIYPEGESVPHVFSSRCQAVAILNRFKSLKDDHPLKKTMNQECFLNKRLEKLQNLALKHGRDREENETKLLLHKAMLEGHVGLSIEELTNVASKVEVALKSISDRITKITGQPPVYQPSHVQVSTSYITNDMETIGVHAPNLHASGGLDTIGGHEPNLSFNGNMYTMGAQVPTPHLTDGMYTIGALVLAPQVASNTNTIGAQTPSPHFTGGMHTVGAQAQPRQHETWLELMRTGGGDLDAPACSAFDGGATTSATAGLNNDEMMPPFSPGADFVCPWGGPDLGPSSGSFLPM
ncbi:hypothetical protein ACQ4PT_050240 [Festuca glaucescens]